MGRRQFGVSPLADILLDSGVLSSEELDAALAEQRHAGLRLDETLVRGGYATDNRIARRSPRVSACRFCLLTKFIRRRRRSR